MPSNLLNDLDYHKETAGTDRRVLYYRIQKVAEQIDHMAHPAQTVARDEAISYLIAALGLALVATDQPGP